MSADMGGMNGDILKDIQRLSMAVEEKDCVRAWVMLRKISYRLETGTRLGEEESENLLQNLEKIMDTMYDFALAKDVLHLVDLIHRQGADLHRLHDYFIRICNHKVSAVEKEERN